MREGKGIPASFNKIDNFKKSNDKFKLEFEFQNQIIIYKNLIFT